MTRALEAYSPRISVIIIFYNAERFFDESIESVRAQTYDSWELILVDDGSTDGGTAIAERHVAEDPDRIRLVSHPNGENRGMSASRNRGLAVARGEFIAFLDADDIWGQDQLAQQVRYLDEYPEASAVYGRLMNWYSWPGSPWTDVEDSSPKSPFPSETLVQPPEMLQTITQVDRRFPYFYGMCSFMVRRTWIEQVGGFEDEFPSLYEDSVFHVKLFLTAPVLVVDTCWGWYRRHPDSTYQRSLRSLWPRLTADAAFAKWLFGYLESHELRGDPVVSQGMQWAAPRKSIPLRALRNPVYAFAPLLPRPMRKKFRPAWDSFRHRRRTIMNKLRPA